VLANCGVYAGDLSADSLLLTVFQIFNILKHVRVTCEYDIQTDRQRDGQMDRLHDSKLLHFIVLHAQLGQCNLV